MLQCRKILMVLKQVFHSFLILVEYDRELTLRFTRLLSSLSFIFTSFFFYLNNFSNKFTNVFSVFSTAAKDDGSIAVALGYTAHLVLMMSFFLQIPLRYPVIHKGSRSTIKDTITDKLTEKERE